MRSKILLALGLFVALSGGSAYAQVTDDHDVELTLSETRTITIAGAPSIAISRSTLGTTFTTDNTSTIVIEHDIGFNQKITVSATANGGDWTGRSLRVNANPATGGLGWSGVAVQTDLVVSGVFQPVADFITGIGATGGAPTAAMPLVYGGAAGLTAVADQTINPSIATVEYTLLDN